MAHETRVGLLVGMGFIVCFAIILSNRGGLDRVAPQMPYQIFGGQSGTAERPAANPGTDVHQDSFPRLSMPAGLGEGQLSPRPSHPANPQALPDPQRLIQRRRSLLPSRELAAAGGDAGPANEPMGGGVPAEVAAFVGGPEADGEFVDPSPDAATETELVLAGDGDQDPAEPETQSRRAALPSELQAFADQLEVVTAQDPKSDQPVTDETQVEHVIAKGDTLGRIARRYYGSASTEVMDAIVAANRGKLRSANALVVGRALRLPTVGDRLPAESIAEAMLPPAGGVNNRSAAEDKAALLPEDPAGGTVVLAASSKPGRSPETTSRREWRWYTVKKGDLYSTIAKEQLGTARRWKELLALNKDVCPDARQLRQGLQIRIPNDTLADAR